MYSVWEATQLAELFEGILEVSQPSFRSPNIQLAQLFRSMCPEVYVTRALLSQAGAESGADACGSDAHRGALRLVWKRRGEAAEKFLWAPPAQEFPLENATKFPLFFTTRPGAANRLFEHASQWGSF